MSLILQLSYAVVRRTRKKTNNKDAPVKGRLSLPHYKFQDALEISSAGDRGDEPCSHGTTSDGSTLACVELSADLMNVAGCRPVDELFVLIENNFDALSFEVRRTTFCTQYAPLPAILEDNEG